MLPPTPQSPSPPRLGSPQSVRIPISSPLVPSLLNPRPLCDTTYSLSVNRNSTCPANFHTGLRTYFQVSILYHRIRVASACNLRCSFSRLLSRLSCRLSRRLGDRKDLNSPHRVSDLNFYYQPVQWYLSLLTSRTNVGKDGLESASFLFEQCVPRFYYPHIPSLPTVSNIPELGEPLMARSQSCGMRDCIHPSIPKTKYKLWKKNITCIAPQSGSPPSASP